MSSASSHIIKGRKTAKDIFITPLELAKRHIDMIDCLPYDKWLDCCKNDGSYYNQFPTNNKDYCEILEEKDFLEYKGHVDIICSNPPYSIIDEWLTKSIELNPRIISYLLGIHNLTAKRMEWLQKAGYGLTKITMCKIQEWYGMSIMVVFEKNKDSIMGIDRTVYYKVKPLQLVDYPDSENEEE